MPLFEIDGITLMVREKFLTDPLRDALGSGRYENREAGALKAHLRPSDRVLDIGAGIGYVAIQAARIAGAENVVSVEPTPGLQGMLRHNLDANGAGAVTVLSAAVVDDATEAPTVTLDVARSFWASSVAEDDADAPRAGISHSRDVPALRMTELLRATLPSVVVMDVEGAEGGLARADWPRAVRLVILEIHRGTLGPAGVRDLFAAFLDAGFSYHPHGSAGAVVVFERVPESDDSRT